MTLYDAVVVGSGFGGAVAAEGIARLGKSVLILERGDEWALSNMDKSPHRSTSGFPVPLLDGQKRFEHAHDPRYIYSLFEDVLDERTLLAVAAGVGGGSLIYSNISERAPARILDPAYGPAWPTGWSYTRLTSLYDRVEGKQDASGNWTIPYKLYSHIPKHQPSRYLALKYALEQILGVGSYPLARVAVRGKGSACVGSSGDYCQGRCRYCGFCTFGCAFGAKQSLMMNYLPRARHFGALLWKNKLVTAIRPLPGGVYRVYFKQCVTGSFVVGVSPSSASETYVDARAVVLAAGALNTPKILLQSKKRGFLPALSSHVGSHLTGNGDYVTGLYLPPTFSFTTSDGLTVSHTNYSAFKGRVMAGITRGLAQTDGILIEDLWGPPVGIAAKFPIRLHDPAWADRSSDWDSVSGKVTRWKNPSLYGPRQKALIRDYPRRAVGLAFLGEDGGNGRVFLDANDNLKVVPPTLTQYGTYQWWTRAVRSKLPVGTRFVETEHERRNGDYFSSVHLLGTCRMANDVGGGACDANGQLFGYPNLYVCDGSVIPRATIVNPTWTILAVAEGIGDWIVTHFPG